MSDLTEAVQTTVDSMTDAVKDATAAATDAAADAAAAATEAAGDAADAATAAAGDAAAAASAAVGDAGDDAEGAKKSFSAKISETFSDWDCSNSKLCNGLRDLKNVVLYPLATGIMTGVGFVAGKRAAERYFYPDSQVA